MRPKHWLNYEKYSMAHEPLKMTIEQTHRELHHAWVASYSPERNAEAVIALSDRSVGNRIFHLISRLAFRAIYFPQITKMEWGKVIFENRRTIFNLALEVLHTRQTFNKLGRLPTSSDLPLKADTLR